MTYDEAKELLKAKKQEEVLRGFDDLSGDEQKMLIQQVEAVDWSIFDAISHKNSTGEKKIEPLGAVTVEEIAARHDEFETEGLKTLKAGKVAALLLAGGMGTRLGFDKPKGELNVGIENTLYIFECLMNNLMAVTRRVGTTIPLYIMTSEKNDADTRAFFEEKAYFGYPKEEVKFFIQEMAPAVDYQGKLLKEAPGRLATSPNGNGGWFSSLAKAGYLSDIHKRGVEWINIFAVDNVLQKMADPVFIGATVLSGCESGSKVIRKADPFEKLGVLCKVDGHPSIVEYYEMTEDMATSKDDRGNLLYNFGVTLNYLFKVEKLEQIVSQKLPVHVVEKKIPYLNENGELIKPEKPNGYKFEQLVVDMVQMMDDTLPYEVVREKEFAPIKNLHGVDSLDTARELLKKNGVKL